MSETPFVSIALPLSPDADPALLKIFLQSVSRQTYREFELLVFVSTDSPRELHSIVEEHQSIRLLTGSTTKSAARNLLASRARGTFMLCADVDLELNPALLDECVSLAIGEGSLAVITPKREAPTKRYWGKCRALEKEIIAGDLSAESPDFLHLPTFRAIGGFDESLDPLDDWALSLRLGDRGIDFDRAQSISLIRETSSMVEMARRKFRRGQALGRLLDKYPDAAQVRFRTRFLQSYARNWRSLARAPHISIGLAMIKILDVVALTLGKSQRTDDPAEYGARAYRQNTVAEGYDEARSGSNYNRFKHYAEIRSLLALMKYSTGSLVEIGCGTGRVTSELAKQGFHVFPTDVSRAMLRQFATKPALPFPILADGSALPLRDNSTVASVSIRVIWHLPTMQDLGHVFQEMTRVASSFVITDITNKRRWLHPLTRVLASIYFRLRPNERRAHETSLLLTQEELAQLAEQSGLRLEETLPLDVLTPIWLNILPEPIARTLFPVLYTMELVLSSLIPPARFLAKLVKR